ncbi:unnamed protein product, partial [Tetraodon nigroviridis]
LQQDIEKFSDIEKLFLYLKLPSGPSSNVDKSDQSALSSSRTQQMLRFQLDPQSFGGIPRNLSPKAGGVRRIQQIRARAPPRNIPALRADRSFCDNLNYHPLSAADFGKMMKNVFPNMKARRLGMRGKSKYPSLECIVAVWPLGLRKRPFVQTPSLPSLDLCKTGEGCQVSEAPGQLSNLKEDVRFAACDLVCEWAQKVLKRQFDAVEDLARFLIDSHYISNKSLAALTITASTAADVSAPQSASAFVPAAELHSFQPHVQQNSPQLISSAPSGIVDKKMLPVNFQLMTQPVQALKPGPPSAQNLLVGPSAEAAAPDSVRSDPAQPSAAAAITLHSPSAMIIGNSPIKTVMTTCHVSPVSLVKMAPISLALNSSCTTTSLSQSGLLSAPAGISIPAAEEEDAGLTQSMRSSSEEATPSRAGVAVQRAASVPIPHTRGFLSPEELSGTNFRERSSSNTDAAESKIGSSENTSTLQSVPSDQNTTAASLPGTALLEEQSRFVSKGFSSTKTLRKRSGVSPDLSLVKRVYMPQQAAGGAAGPGYRVRNAVCGPPKAGAPARPESAPPPRELPPPSDCDYFQFDDDVTQDSIVEELVQMEEQMKLNLQHFGGCAPAGQQPAAQSSKLAAHQNLSAYYQTASRHSNPIQTPTPTPTPTSEMLGGSHGLAGESPCSHMASVTPVDSALGSSRHTPVGTPHSNSSSTVPCSPVECRNPFAFTPINSSVTGLHDGSTVSNSPVKPMQRPTATHPDKTRLEWMNYSSSSSSSSSSSGSLNKSNGGMGIAPSYQGLIGDHFQKPHAFAVPHARHHDTHFGRLTPVSPVQQQAASMAGLNRQEEFAVPAPLDNKASNAPSTTSRCRSVSPAVHQRNLSGNAGSVPYVPRSVLSPFSSPVTPEMLNIFGNGQTGVGVSGLAQRSHSVPLNVMMQTEVAPAAPRQGGVGNEVLLRKLEEEFTDGVQGLGNSHVPSSYTARLNLTQVLESRASLSGGESRLGLLAPESSSCKQRNHCLMENVLRDKRSSLRRSARPCRPPRSAPTGQPLLFSLSSQQHPQLDFSCTMKDLLTDTSIAAGLQQMEEAGLAAVGSDVSCDIRMKSELPSSISDLNAMDTNLLFDPDQQQGQYLNAAADVAWAITCFSTRPARWLIQRGWTGWKAKTTQQLV